MEHNIKIEANRIETAIDWSPHHHAFINPYNGCQAGCPFCFWLSEEGWEGRIQVRENIPEILDQELKDWPDDQFIYLGSVCDPFMDLDQVYGLTRSCLEIIQRHEIPLLITTSAMNSLIFRDVDLLMGMKKRVVIVVELSRIKQIEALNGGSGHVGIRNANQLSAMGFEVWATLSPILPEITDLDIVLKQLNPQIPVYIDSLQMEKDSIQARRTLEWINHDYPNLMELYKNIICSQDLSYFSELQKKYRDNPRVLTFPFQL